MSQIISRNKPRLDELEELRRRQPIWKKPFMLIFHGLTASTYGFAICYQNVSGKRDAN